MTAPGTQVDIAPTLLGLAGVEAAATMDGHSIVPFLISDDGDALDSTRSHLRRVGSLDAYEKSWRKEVFVEYYYCSYNVKCTSQDQCSGGAYPKKDSNCVNLADNTDCWCGSGPTNKTTCYETEDLTNNFIAVR